jgi:hypothetical protein
MYDYPEMDNLSEEDMNALVYNELSDLVGGEGNIIITNPISANSITIDEVWYCIGEAVGWGIGSALGLVGLKQAGIKVTMAITKRIS